MKAKYYEDYEHTSRSGDFVVHFSKDDEPVLIEILNASKFLKETNRLLPKRIRNEILPELTSPSVAHRIK